MNEFAINLIEKKYSVDMQGVTFLSESAKNSIVTGEVVNGNKVLYIKDGKAYLASNNNEDCFNKVIGVSQNAVGADEIVNFKITGTLNGFGSLIQNKIYYLGTNGDLTDTMPINGIVQVIGIAKTNEELFIDLSTPIKRI